ncbi:trigger factor [Gynuella sunshinyii]|uniref:Trigger factor n=1 Tax=Gynuella sunshinyii YC6258 TaxID=1445510 RepID=A0A0C5VNG4_9GAMM|nr:trigger factor [Gynuella sunshinyii]AJQ95851.1 FKBP-type peptidyl-prolyl cis-trans isomerase (trigger factor) [Gynuella sunshinyii YC6258]
MQISVETTSSLERRMTIGLPAEKIDSEVEKRLKDTARRVKIDGFRPGKVPVSVVRQRYGAGIRQEVVGEVMRNSWIEAISQEKITPAGMPTVEPVKNEKGEDFEFTATFEVYPQIELADLSSLEVEKASAEVLEADVDNMLQSLQKQKAEYVDVDRACQKDDKVKIDFVGRVDGEEFEGGKAEAQELVLGSGRMIPGFEEGVEGMAVGEEKTITVRFPDEYQAENLKGKDAEFDIKLHVVQEPKLPEINQEFIESFNSKATNLDEFKADIQKNMERESKQALGRKLKDSVVTQLLEKHDIPVPAALTKDEIQRLKYQAVQQFGGGQEFDPNALPDELFKDQAERRVKTGLIMNEIIKKFEIRAESEAVRAYIEELASVYQDPQSVIDYYYNNKEQLSQVEAVVIEDAVIEKIVSEAKVTEVSVTYEDSVKQGA